MKACVIQPWYSFEEQDTDHCFNQMISLLDQCDESMDLIVLPEYTDVPAAQPDKKHFHASIRKYNQTIIEKSVQTAVRCQAIVFVNAAFETPEGYRNGTPDSPMSNCASDAMLTAMADLFPAELEGVTWEAKIDGSTMTLNVGVGSIILEK